MDPLLIATFSLLGGFLLSRLMDHVRTRDHKRDVSKSIALYLLPIAEALKKNSGFLEQALPGGRRSLRGYFIAIGDVVPPKEVKAFETRVHDDLRLKHRMLADLRATAEAIGIVARWHQQVRNTVELSDEWYADRETYRRLLENAQQLVEQSLLALERLAPSDTRTAIRAFRGGVQ